MRDSWLHLGVSRGPRTWAQQKRRFRALGVPSGVVETVQHWARSPDTLEPLLRLVQNIVFSNAVHRARAKDVRWAAGTARDPHHKRTPEQPGAMSPIVELVERVIADLERLSHWEFNPPIELHQRDAKLKLTRQVVRLSRLDEVMREAFEKARKELLWMRENLRKDTQRSRGRKATLVQPYRVSALSRSTELPKPARRRELMRMLRDQILALHPDREKRRHAARAEAAGLAREIIDSSPVLN